MKLNQAVFVVLLWEMPYKDCLRKKMPLHIIAVTPGKSPAQPEITRRHTTDRQTKVWNKEKGEQTLRMWESSTVAIIAISCPPVILLLNRNSVYEYIWKYCYIFSYPFDVIKQWQNLTCCSLTNGYTCLPFLYNSSELRCQTWEMCNLVMQDW